MTDSQVQEQRESVYGPWKTNMRATSLQLEGILVQWQANNPGKRLPEWWAPMLLVVTKLNRIASGVYHEDNFVDLRNYLGFIEAMQREPSNDLKVSPTGETGITDDPIHESGR